MKFNIELVKCIENESKFVANISSQNVNVSSYPLTATQMYSDLKINRLFLNARKSRKIFFGDEPIINVSFENCDSISIFLYKKSLFGTKKFIDTLEVDLVLSSFDFCIEMMSDEVIKLNIDENYFATRITNELRLGVYDSYINNSIMVEGGWIKRDLGL